MHNNAIQNSISFTQLFRFATRFDLILIITGTAASIITGTALPIFAYISGSMIDAFQNNTQIYEETKKNLYYYLVLGVVAGVTAMLMFTGWTIAGERQSIQCRKQYFRSILRQEVAWFDTQKQVQISNNFSADALSFQLAVGQKISTLIMLIAMTLTGLGISFYQGWILSCVILAYLPIILFCWYKNGDIIHKRNELVDKVYVQADSRAQQSLSAIRLVKQMNAEEFELQNNAKLLQKVKKETTQSGVYYAWSVFFAILSLNLGFTLSFWYGSECVFGTEKCPADLNRKAYTAGSIIKIFYSLLLPAITLNQLTPCIQKISQGKSAAARIFKIIDRQPQIKSKENALKPASFKGIFVFDKVGFAYPKNKKLKILENLDLTIDCSNSAIIGDSGCGKSTIFQLMMRFYDADEGTIYLDGVDIRELDLEWLRNKIGYVQQEPTLFAVSLRQNLLLGKQDATEQELVEVLKKAEAYEFFQELKDGFETFVGNGGCQLSGGQKQRIAIARSLLKCPKILLLDEATSALDRQNQKQILTTLKKLGKDFVTISITHRMKVLEDCDKIYTFKNKKIEKITEKSNQKHMLSAPNHEQLKKQSDVSDNQMAQKTQTIKNNLAGVDKDLNDRSNARLNFEIAQNAIISQQIQESKLSRITPYLFKNRCILIVGAVMGILDGLTFPILGVMLAQIITAQMRYNENKNYYSERVRVYCYVCLGIAIFSAVWNTVLHLCLFQVSAHSIKQIRQNAYNKILKMPIPWFDRQQNHPQKIINHLSVNCKNLSSFVQMFLPHMVIIVINILFCVVGSIVFDWRTGLTSIALIPLILIAQTIQFHFVQGFNQSSGKNYQQSSQIISESIMNIRTILALQAEILIHRYQKQLNKIYEQIVGRCLLSGMMYGISYFLQYITIGLIFFFSAIFITNYSIEVSNSFAAIFLILFACTSAGNNAAFLGDLSKAKNAANNLFSIFELQDQQQIRIKSGSQLLCKQIKGDIIFKNVSFKYQSRDHEALKNVSFDVKAGLKIDLVGSSGCGKSTVFSLLQGFYPPTGGSIFIDGININEYDLHHLRKTFGVVSQEPTLFNESISQNIKYNHKDATIDQIIKAAKLANFYPTQQRLHLQKQQDKKVKDLNKVNDANKQQVLIVVSGQHLAKDDNSNIQNSSAFDKNVGPKGSHISGGQKQRIAIARALLRNPTIYLLDQATSALDPQNQKIIQSSLDTIMANKTTLGISHQLEVVEHSQQILVFNLGQIVERGSYKQLCQKRGEFSRIFGININT